MHGGETRAQRWRESWNQGRTQEPRASPPGHSRSRLQNTALSDLHPVRRYRVVLRPFLHWPPTKMSGCGRERPGEAPGPGLGPSCWLWLPAPHPRPWPRANKAGTCPASLRRLKAGSSPHGPGSWSQRLGCSASLGKPATRQPQDCSFR